MIYTDRQLSATRAELDTLRAALEGHIASGDAGAEEWLRQTHIDALRSQIAEFETEIAEYELLRSRTVRYSEMASLEELPRVLVQARIASGMSQTYLAEKLGMKPQQVQRYEATNYMGASLARLIEVASVLKVKLSNSYGAADTASSLITWNSIDDVSWSAFPAKEMLKRRWIAPRAGESLIDAARAFVTASAGPQLAATAFHRKKVRSGASPDAYALLAWQARVLSVASAEATSLASPEFKLNETWLANLVGISRRDDGPSLAKEMLAEQGIVLVIEEHLSGTYLDGAAMLDAKDIPVVGMTLRHDRLDNFWFTLFHEIGHIFRHLFEGKRFDFFDEGEAALSDDLEQEADKFALETLISPVEWDQCLSRFALSEEAVRIDAQRLGLHASILAGRIRKERNDYTILNSLIGQGSVRSQFPEFRA